MGSDKDDNHFDAAYSLETGEQTRNHYASWAKTYDQEVNEQNAYAQPARVAEMLKRFMPASDFRILDAGCGSGLSGVALSEAGYTTIDGCDFSPEMLAEARQKDTYRKLFAADLNVGLPGVSQGDYHAITCVGVFSFGHVQPDACDEFLRILPRGGYLIIALNDPFWQRGDLAEKLAQLESADKIIFQAKEYGAHLPGHDVKGWVIALEKK